MEKGGFGYTEGTYIFQDIDFSLEKGEVLCLLGPNGTGKSTLIKCLTKILSLDKGTILY
ncbi:MAG: ABC transporter ATP-binding protein, partial [Methanofastidiosum sp.]